MPENFSPHSYKDEAGNDWTLADLLADLDRKDYLYLTPKMCADLAQHLRQCGPKTPQVPTDEMKKAGASVRVNLHFHNQGISGFLSEYEAGEIYERMEEKRT